ncbi:hypothetical protein ACFU3E_02600 [Streptomyces sp. NPDC057424]|uniref:hypothetical protein n=1 Tax=Streptomyces sp. NPDC057424 TaxID=3346127 RepID=UPI00367D6A65
METLPVPGEVLARTVFGPLGGVVEIGAVNLTGTWELAGVSVGAFVALRRDDVDRILDGIRSVCRFTDDAMAIIDELGYLREHQVSTAVLLLWSGAITGVPRPFEQLEDPRLVRRMCRVGADLQLTSLLQALVTAVIAAGTGARQGAVRIAEILEIASDLADTTDRSAPADVFRMWRVTHLSAVLRPDSDAPETGRAGFRAYGQTLEELLGA